MIKFPIEIDKGDKLCLRENPGQKGRYPNHLSNAQPSRVAVRLRKPRKEAVLRVLDQATHQRKRFSVNND